MEKIIETLDTLLKKTQNCGTTIIRKSVLANTSLEEQIHLTEIYNEQLYIVNESVESLKDFFSMNNNEFNQKPLEYNLIVNYSFKILRALNLLLYLYSDDFCYCKKFNGKNLHYIKNIVSKDFTSKLNELNSVRDILEHRNQIWKDKFVKTNFDEFDLIREKMNLGLGTKILYIDYKIIILNSTLYNNMIKNKDFNVNKMWIDNINPEQIIIFDIKHFFDFFDDCINTIFIHIK